MNIEIIAAVIESVFYAGRPKTDKKMDRDDFEQLARIAHASIMRKLYYEANEQGNPYLYFADNLEARPYKVSAKYGRAVIDMGSDIARLPYGLGVFSVSILGNDDALLRKIHQGEAGGEWIYSGKEFAGTMFYIKKGRRLFLYQLQNGEHEVEVEGIFNDTDIDIPEDVAFDVANIVLGLTLQVAGFPVDKTNDNNPNVTTLKQQLAQPQSIQ